MKSVKSAVTARNDARGVQIHAEICKAPQLSSSGKLKREVGAPAEKTSKSLLEIGEEFVSGFRGGEGTVDASGFGASRRRAPQKKARKSYGARDSVQAASQRHAVRHGARQATSISSGAEGTL